MKRVAAEASQSGRLLIPALLAITVVKLALTAIPAGSQQVVELKAQAEAFLAGKDLFDARNTANSPSFFLMGNYLLAAACRLLSNASGVPFVVVIKWPAVLADLGVSLLLLLRGDGRPALLYLLSPVSFVLSVYHGQLHTVALFACLLALRLVERNRAPHAGAALALAASVRQHFAALLAVLVARPPLDPPRKRLLVAFGLVFAIVNAPLLLTTTSVARAAAPALNYGGWGYGMLLLQAPRVLSLAGLSQPAQMLSSLNRALSASANLVALVWPLVFTTSALIRRPRDPWRGAFVYILGLYVFTPGVAVQWLVWALPFYLVLAPRAALAYSLLAGGFIVGSYWKSSLNASHGVYALTRQLELLSRGELFGVLCVGTLGVLTWGLCAIRLVRGARE